MSRQNHPAPFSLQYDALQRHYTEQFETIIPQKKELRCLSPNSYIHVSMCNLYVYSQDWSVYFAEGK
jgi:hypothetical protein